jgi:hypothetical protein
MPEPIWIGLVIVVPPQVTLTEPVPRAVLPSMPKDQVNAPFASAVWGPSPAAVLRARDGVVYVIEHAVPGVACTDTVAVLPGGPPRTVTNRALSTAGAAGCD